jgi:hypothetical protein
MSSYNNIKHEKNMSVAASASSLQAMKSSLDQAFNPFFTHEAWGCPRQIIDGVSNLVVICGGVHGPALYPPHERFLERVAKIFQKTKAHLEPRQRAFLEVLEPRIRVGLAENVSKGRFPKGAAEIVTKIVSAQIVLPETLHPSLASKQKLDLSTTEGIIDAVHKYGWIIFFINPDYRTNRKLALAALSQNLVTARFFEKELYNSRNFIKAAAHIDGFVLYFLTDPWIKDEEIALEAAMQNGRSIQFASPEVRKLRRIAEAAVFQAESAREFVDHSLHGDLDVSMSTALGVFQKVFFLGKALGAEEPAKID